VATSPPTAARRPLAAVSWSGGKDSCAALQRVVGSFDVIAMVTMFDEAAARSRSHGLRPEVLDAQARRLGVRRVTGRGAWDTYDAGFTAALQTLRQEGVTHVIFGDILFEEHRRWAEAICSPLGLTAVEPLWGASTDDLFEEWLGSGGDAIIVTARAAALDASWLGLPLRAEMGPRFKQLGVDACGERGEYHTVVTSHPLFRSPLAVRLGARVERSGCWAVDVMVDDADGG
jgi:uncharacterized protein (TIGR00290 family)